MCYNKHMHKSRQRTGFTLVELAISIGFIALLSITVAVITTNLISAYQRGLTMKQVNTTGMDIIDDLKSAISNSSAKEITNLCSTVYSDSTARSQCESDGAYNFVSLTRTATVTIGKDAGSEGTVISSTPVYGAFCTGTYSYIWNSGYFFDTASYIVAAPAKASFTYRNGANEKKTISEFRLLKVLDPNRSVCVAAITGADANNYDAPSDLSANFDVSDSDRFGKISEDPIDIILNSGSDNLAFYDLDLAKPAQNEYTKNALYSGTFILATVKGGINIMAGGNYCSTPENYKVQDFNYCAINKFNFAIQATGD